MSNAKWINLPTVAGIRKTSIADTLSFDVEAFSTIAPDVDRVVFTFSGPGNYSSSVTVSSRSMRFPNFSSYPSRLPGALPGSLAPIWCFGTSVVCGSLPLGMIAVTADVYYSSGASAVNIGTTRFLNDWDGGDRRHSSRQIRMRGQTGNDTGGGGVSDPVKSLMRAIELCRNNPIGNPTSQVDMNCGGAEILIEELVEGCGSVGSFNWHTGDQWLTLKMLPGASFRKAASNNGIICPGINDSGNCSIRFENWTMRGPGPSLFGTGYPTSNVRITYWFENLEKTSQFYDPAKPWSIRYLEDDGKAADISGIQDVLNLGRGYFTGLYCHHLGYGPASYAGIYDFKIDHYIGIALQPEGPMQGDYAINGVISNQALKETLVLGYISTIAGANLTTSQPSAGIMRLESTAQLYQTDAFLNPTAQQVRLDTQLAEIVGSTRWHLHVVTSGPFNGIFLVTAVGTTGGGNPFVEVDTLGAVTIPSGSAPAGTRLIVGGPGPNSQAGVNPPVYDPHPDLVQWLGTRNGSMVAHVRCENIRESQGFFMSGDLNDLALVNVTDGGMGIRNPFGLTLTNAFIAHCSFTGNWDFDSGDFHSGVITHNTVRQMTGMNPSGLDISRNHFQQNPLVGTLPSGPAAWYKFPTNVAPHTFEPLDSFKGNGTLGICPPVWRWPGASGSTYGAWANTALGNWGSPAQGLACTMAGSSSVSASVGLIRTLEATAPGSSSMSASARLNQALGAFTFGSSGFTAALRTTVFLDLAARAAGSGSFSAALGSIGSLAAVAASSSTLQAAAILTMVLGMTSSGTSSMSAALSLLQAGDLAAGSSGSSAFQAAAVLTMALGATSSGASSLVASLIKDSIQLSLTGAAVPKVLMKQRIHNALLAIIRTGPFYECSIDSKTGKMTIKLEKPVVPVVGNIKIVERSTVWRPASNYRRSFNVNEIESWSWIARVMFPALEVACEVFEEKVDTGIIIPPVEGLANQRTLLARLASADYSQPPSQSPNEGTIAEFSFEILPETLRK